MVYEFWYCVVNYIINVWQRGVGVAPESCLHNQRQHSEPAGQRRWELDGEQWTDGVRQVFENSNNTSPNKAQHPPLQGKSSFQQPTPNVSFLIWYFLHYCEPKKPNFAFNNFLHVCYRRISTVCTLVSCCSLERRFPCCCCCLPARTSAPATGLWWASRSMGSPCPCRSLSWVGGEKT